MRDRVDGDVAADGRSDLQQFDFGEEHRHRYVDRERDGTRELGPRAFHGLAMRGLVELHRHVKAPELLEVLRGILVRTDGTGVGVVVVGHVGVVFGAVEHFACLAAGDVVHEPGEAGIRHAEVLGTDAVMQLSGFAVLRFSPLVDERHHQLPVARRQLEEPVLQGLAGQLGIALTQPVDLVDRLVAQQVLNQVKVGLFADQGEIQLLDVGEFARTPVKTARQFPIGLGTGIAEDLQERLTGTANAVVLLFEPMTEHLRLLLGQALAFTDQRTDHGHLLVGCAGRVDLYHRRL